MLQDSWRPATPTISTAVAAHRHVQDRETVRVQGCDLFDLAPDGPIARRDSFLEDRGLSCLDDQAGRKRRRAVPSPVSAKTAVTGRSTASCDGSTSTMLVITRGPSSSST